MKVAIFGASGFVGAALTEHLLESGRAEVVPCINKLGNAWRFSRANIPVHSVDIMSPAKLAPVLDGVTHVVNCTRGSTAVMLQGLKNLLDASKDAKVKRFVHLSSISVYGDPPAADSMSEDAPANPDPGTYGWEKLKQDEMVEAAHASGLASVVLCPPNISGIFSSFVYNVLSDMRAGTLALVEEGTRPNSTIDVENLVHAIMLGLETEHPDAKRIFVSDGEDLVWKDLADALMPLAERAGPLPSVAAREVTPVTVAVPAPGSVWKSFKHLASSDVREAVRKDPRWARVDKGIRNLVARTGSKMEDRLRHSIEGPVKVSKVPDSNAYSSRYMTVQLRGIRHRLDRARDVLGYRPPLSFQESMRRYRDWHSQMYGFDQPFRPLARAIELL